MRIGLRWLLCSLFYFIYCEFSRLIILFPPKFKSICLHFHVHPAGIISNRFKMMRGECGKTTWYFALAFLGFYKLIVWCRLRTQQAGKKRTILLSMELQGGDQIRPGVRCDCLTRTRFFQFDIKYWWYRWRIQAMNLPNNLIEERVRDRFIWTEIKSRPSD